MKHVWLCALSVMLVLSGCKPRPASPASVAPPPASPQAETTPVGVLLFEDNLDFAGTEPFAGGRDVYRDQVDGLAARLRAQGIAAETVPVPLDAFRAADVARFGMLVVVDTFVILPGPRAALEAYVRAGGTLVGVCEVGRFPGDWAKPWPFEALFGLRTRVTDTYQTGVANGPPGFYRYADLVATGHPLLAGLTGRIDWGEAAQHAWATDPAGAEVLATFPRYLVSTNEDAPQAVVSNTLPALTVHAYGAGRAIFLATLPSARMLQGWDAAPEAVALLARAARSSRAPSLPPEASAAPELTVGINQLGYAPSWPKRVVVRVQHLAPEAALRGTFRVRNATGAVVREGDLTAGADTLWRSRFLWVDLTDLQEPGDYRVELEAAGAAPLSVPLRIASDIRAQLVDSQHAFFQGMRCGETCHQSDPVPGAYHDASGDWALRMWAMPHVLWALARYVEEQPGDEAMRYELDRTARWMWKMQSPDGSPFASVRPADDRSPIELRPPADTAKRELEERYSFEYTATYAAALARSLRPVREHVSLNLAQELQVCAERAFRRIQEEPAASSKDIGNRLWAAVELYRATQIGDYRDFAEREVRRLFAYQLDRGRVMDGNVYGDFFADAGRTTFSPQQWKRFHSIGLYLGLVELDRLLADGPLRTDVRAVLGRFTEGFLLGMSDLSPYGQFAAALEPAQPARPRPDGRGLLPPDQFKVLHFSHRESWVRDHGLNCDLLAMATVALERYRDTGDARLRDMAVRQLNWILGSNPLGYAMLEGYGTAPAPAVDPALGTGPIRGAVPNGIIGRGVDNVPSWGATWDSREYWLPQNAYLLSALALL